MTKIVVRIPTTDRLTVSHKSHQIYPLLGKPLTVYSAITGISIVKAVSFDKDCSDNGIPANRRTFLNIGFISIDLEYAANYF